MLYRILQKFDPDKKLQKIIYRKSVKPQVPNLYGDRDIEYSFISANIPKGPGEALDFGCGTGWMGLLAARRGFNVTAIDLEPVKLYYEHPHLKFVQGDILKLNFPEEHFDLIINCSTIEHVGLKGRYGVTESLEDGDIDAMRILKNILRQGKLMLLTVPVGRDRVFVPLHRVYGERRLSRLLEGWEVLKKEYWVKDNLNRWVCVDESIALNKEPLAHCYGLGLFVLRRQKTEVNNRC